MVTSEPLWKPQINRSEAREDAFLQRRAVQVTVRALSVVVGLVVAAVALVVVGLYGALLTCEGSETHGLCVAHAGLVPVLEWPIFLISCVAPFAGGIASCATKRPQWLLVGVALACAMFGLMILVSTGQTTFDWN